MTLEFNYTCPDLKFDFETDKQLNATMKAIELKYWDYLDNYNSSYITQYDFLEKLLIENGKHTEHHDKITHYWRKYEKYKRTSPRTYLAAPSRKCRALMWGSGYRVSGLGGFLVT